MKLQLNLTNYKNFIDSKKNHTVNNGFQQNNTYKLLDYKNIEPLKNSILFQANQLSENEKRQHICLKLKKYCQNQTDDKIYEAFMISDSTLKSTKKSPEYKLGSRFFEAYHRIAVFKKYPFKTEGQLSFIHEDLCPKIQKQNILNQIIPDRFLPKEIKEGDAYTKKMLSLDKTLGIIILSNSENCHNEAFEFLNDNIKNLLPGFKRNNSCEEILKHELELKGKDYKNLSFIQKRNIDGKLKYQVFYNDMLLGQTDELHKNGKKAREQIQNLLWEIINKVINNKIPFENSNEHARPFVKYKYLNNERIEQLNEFNNKFNLNIKDLNTLHRCTLFGAYDDYIIDKFDSYEQLEYVGDALLDYASYYIYLKNHPDAKNGDFTSVNEFLKNETLSEISKDIGLADLRINTNEKFSDKRYADMFEALIATIYFNDEKNGFNNICRFLEENFLNEILGN